MINKQYNNERNNNKMKTKQHDSKNMIEVQSTTANKKKCTRCGIETGKLEQKTNQARIKY